jgi:hypothetical protein
MFEHGIAFHAREQIRAERHSLRVGDDIHTRHAEDVEIHIPGYEPVGAADIQIPAPEWEIARLSRIVNEWERRL